MGSPLSFRQFISAEFSAESPVLEADAKTLSIQQRMSKRRELKKIKSRIKLARKLAMKRSATSPVLQKRSSRNVRSVLFKKFAKGKTRKSMTSAQRANIERRLNRVSKGRIALLKKKAIPKLRKLDRERRQKGSSL